jgi:predicted methyltransferase
MIQSLALFSMYNESTGSGRDTHLHEGYQAAFAYARKLMNKINLNNPQELILDLFARQCPWGTIRNDLNNEFLKKGFTNVCKDALQLTKEFKNEEVDIVLLDPPFSTRQATDKYDEVGRASLYTDPAYMSELGKQCFRILSNGGVIVKAGYNSNPPAQGLTLRAIMLSRYGASRNDVIFTVWQKTQTTLF